MKDEKRKIITDFDITQVQDKVHQITGQIKTRDTTIDKMEKSKEQIDKDIEKLKTQVNKDITRSLGKVIGDNPFIHNVRTKLKQLHDAIQRAEKTHSDFIGLYQKSFKRVSNDRITTRITLDVHYYYSQSYLTLYPKGFGYTTGDTSPSKYIGDDSRDDWNVLKQIFNSDKVTRHITKQDKVFIFNSFSEAISNWIDVPKYVKNEREKDEILGKFKERNTNPNMKSRYIPYYKVETDYNDNVENISQENVKLITMKNDTSNRLFFEIVTDKEEHTKYLDRNEEEDFDFGMVFALSIVWRQVEEIIDQLIRKYDSITENNELVLQQLKRKVAHYIVVEEL